MKKAIALAGLAGVVAIFSLAQEVNHRTQDRSDMKRVQVADERQTLDRGRLGSQESMPDRPLTLHGILVDASCYDRTQENLLRPPVPLPQLDPAETQQMASAENQARAQIGYATGDNRPKNASVSAAGITVDAQTLENERADILDHQVPDLISREEEPTCAVNARTSNFALLTDNGRLLNLDGGGNVYAWQAVESSSNGALMLNGKSLALKPQVTVKGIIRGDRLMVESVNLG